MDSEDEAHLRDLDQSLQAGRHSTCKYLFSNLEMRLYEKEERTAIFDTMRWIKRGSEEVIQSEDWGSMPRFRRFFHTIRGFHQGSLDLTGRHEPRYRKLLKRWSKLIKDILEVANHVEVTEVEMKGRDGEVIFQDNHYDVSPPEILEHFARKWRSRGVSLAFILHSAREVSDFIKEHSKPVFQKLLLQSLPPEIHCHIMQVGGLHEARLLGSTCRYFRNVSLSYVYESRCFDIPWKMSARDSPQDSHPHESLPERRKHLETRAQESRGGLVEELDFVLSHPQTTNVTKTLTIFGHRYEHVCNLLHYEVGTPEYDTFFGPLHRRVHEVLKRAVNISMLVLNNVPIDSGMALATVSLNRLQTLWIRSCNYLEGAPLPQCPSVLNFVLIIHQPGQVDSWKLLPAFPNLRFLALCGNFSEECPEALPAWEFQASFNPFRTLERLSIRDIGPDDTSSLITWLRRADELRLTHFQFQSGDIALQPDDTLQLIEVLARSPIQVLALVGTRYAEPDLIGVIAETFPGLIALTLSYRDSFRQTQDQGAIWPRPSWEYASQVGRFSKLEYFAWNLKVIPMPIAWSATFSLFQDEFPDINSHRWIKYFGYTPEEDSEEYHDDFRSIVLALSAYTPSLKLVAFTHHITQFSEISHGSDGSTNILFDRMVTQPLHIMEEYSPYDYEEWEVNVSTARVLSDVEDSTEL